jgi:hypothetical protein
MAAKTTSAQEDVSANDSPIYTLFSAEVTDVLTADTILRLAVGVVGAVLVKRFLPLNYVRDIIRALEDIRLDSYDERLISPAILKLGPAAYDFYGKHALEAAYWDHAERAARIRQSLLPGSDPMDLAIARLRNAWEGPVELARSGGRPMFAGMIREIHDGAKLHFDEITRESPGLLDETPASYLTLNWYFSVPADGGGTSVFKHPWHPRDEQHRDGYGYAESVVENDPVATVRPETGDALLFDTRNLHLVRPVNGPGRRVSLSFFLGVTRGGSLQLWS